MNLSNVLRFASVEPRGEVELDECKRKIRTLGSRVIEDCIEIGRQLIKAREILRGQYQDGNHNGYWLAWLRDDVVMSHMQANRFIRVAERYGGVNDVVNPHLSSFSVLAELAAPEADPEGVAEVESQLARGQTVTVEQAREAVKGGKGKGKGKGKKAETKQQSTKPAESKLQKTWNNAGHDERRVFVRSNKAEIRKLLQK